MVAPTHTYEQWESEFTFMHEFIFVRGVDLNDAIYYLLRCGHGHEFGATPREFSLCMDQDGHDCLLDQWKE